MGDSLWSAFTETGEPMCYLLCKAEEKGKAGPPSPGKEKKARRVSPGADGVCLNAAEKTTSAGG